MPKQKTISDADRRSAHSMLNVWIMLDFSMFVVLQFLSGSPASFPFAVHSILWVVALCAKSVRTDRLYLGTFVVLSVFSLFIDLSQILLAHFLYVVVWKWTFFSFGFAFVLSDLFMTMWIVILSPNPLKEPEENRSYVPWILGWTQCAVALYAIIAHAVNFERSVLFSSTVAVEIAQLFLFYWFLFVTDVGMKDREKRETLTITTMLITTLGFAVSIVRFVAILSNFDVAVPTILERVAGWIQFSVGLLSVFVGIVQISYIKIKA